MTARHAPSGAMHQLPRVVEVAANAKINLYLRVLAREASGYHQLETLFLRVGLSDTVRVARTAGARSLDVTGDVDLAPLGPTDRNLAWRAAESYCAATGLAGGFAIVVEKRIPIGGGLGGGSSDAGAVIRALDAMNPSPIGLARRLDLAATLGADVPFLAGEHAYVLAWGRGERMLALKPPSRRLVLLVIPPFGVNTADAFAWVDEQRAGDPASAGSFAFDDRSLHDWDAIAGFATNDFEAVVAARHPDVAQALAHLRGAPTCQLAQMSGSGSTLFLVSAAGGGPLRWQAPDGTLGGFRGVATRTLTRVEPVKAIE